MDSVAHLDWIGANYHWLRTSLLVHKALMAIDTRPLAWQSMRIAHRFPLRNTTAIAKSVNLDSLAVRPRATAPARRPYPVLTTAFGFGGDGQGTPGHPFEQPTGKVGDIQTLACSNSGVFYATGRSLI